MQIGILFNFSIYSHKGPIIVRRPERSKTDAVMAAAAILVTQIVQAT